MCTPLLLSSLSLQLERTVAELGREKEDLETRLEEDQDEVDDLLSKQRIHITQMSALQGQLGEARAEVEELQEAKVALENKVRVCVSMRVCVCVCVCV